MKALVDVLAAMDDAAHELNHARSKAERDALLIARAAVAELIEAAQTTLEQPWEIARLRAALAAAQGGDA